MNIEDYKHRLVNDAQLCINDWQCSGDDDYLHKAAACLKAAAEADAGTSRQSFLSD